MNYQGPNFLKPIVEYFYGKQISIFHRVSQLEIKNVKLDAPELLTEFHYAARIVVNCWPEFNDSIAIAKEFGDEASIETKLYGELTRVTITQ